MSEPAHPPIPITITICGDGGCGKSSITLRLVRSQWTSEYDPTIEDSYSLTRRIDGATYHLGLTDTAGQEEYRGMWATSNLGADAFLMVYDITSQPSLDALQYFNDMIDMESDTRIDNAERARRAGLPPSYPGSGAPGAASYNLYGAPGAAKTVAPIKMVAGNKCDLQDARQVPAATGLEWARRRGCGFMETSARLEVNIEETFALIVRRVVEARLAAEGEARGERKGERRERRDRRGVTKPLGPPGEKRAVGVRGPNLGEDTLRGDGGFWRNLRCW